MDWQAALGVVIGGGALGLFLWLFPRNLLPAICSDEPEPAMSLKEEWQRDLDRFLLDKMSLGEFIEKWRGRVHKLRAHAGFHEASSELSSGPLRSTCGASGGQIIFQKDHIHELGSGQCQTCKLNLLLIAVAGASIIILS